MNDVKSACEAISQDPIGAMEIHGFEHELFGVIPRPVMEGLARYVICGILPGSFLQAVIKDSLTEAAGRADNVNRYILQGYADILVNGVPAQCWG